MDDLLRRLPHRPPFLLLDRVLLLEPGAWAVATKDVDQTFTDATGEWPAVLLAEVMAQIAGLAAARREADGAAVVARIDRFRTRGVTRQGDRLLIVARVLRSFGPTAMVRAAVRCERQRRAAAEIVLRFG